MAKNNKFTRAERQAYHSGKGYAVAHKKRGINFKFSNLKASFMQGYKKGLEMMKRNPLKYAILPKKRKTKG
jgi:hypothetical protein